MTHRTRTLFGLPSLAAVALVALATLAISGAAVAAGTLTLEEAAADLSAPPDDTRDVPSTVWFQGFLADSSTGDPVNATYTVVARIYSLASGGSILWGPETHASVPIVEGWFNIELGSIVSPLPSFETPPYYLQLTVNGETLSPRSKLASVPSALQASATVSADDDWTISGDDIYHETGNLAVGTTSTTDAKVMIYADTADDPALAVQQEGGEGSAPALYVRREQNVYLQSLLDLSQPEDSGPFIQCKATYAQGYDSPFIVCGNGYLYSQGSSEFVADDTGYYDSAVWARGRALDNDSKGVHATMIGLTPCDAVAVYGECSPHDGYGYGGRFAGGYMGAKGEAIGTGAGYYYGLYGLADTPEAGKCYGVRGNAHGAGENYGVYASAADGTTNWAGYFSGNVRVTGVFDNALARMEIDDPTDPENAYLRHPYVASSEMKTVYDGTVTLDAAGEATVEMPDWFEALNTEFRYQLTAVGAPGPDLHIAQKVQGNMFRIAGGEPGMEVCWMVTGVRHDPVATHRAFEVRAPKSPEDRGRYIDAAAHGAPAEREIGQDDERLRE